MSGESNVVYWLKKRSIDPSPALVAAIFSAAKATDHILTEVEIRLIITSHQQSNA